MAQVRVERLDHLGVIASLIKDLGLIDMIDTRLVPDEQEMITPGEAVAAMILNGLGFANRPLSLTPQFFASKPLDLLLREGIDRRFNHLDTTSFSLTGEYVPERDEHAIRITHGYSKDHRPDLKQAVLELMVSQDGGIPFVSKSWDGNTSDTQVFQKRAEALISAFKDTPSPRYLVADAKLYGEDNATHLAKFGFITRIPATLKLVSQVIGQALQGDTWQSFDANTRYQPLALCHYGMARTLAGGVFTGSVGACRSHAEKSHTARGRGHHQATLSPASSTLWHSRSRSRGPLRIGQALEVSPHRVLSSHRTQTLRWQRPSHAEHAPQGPPVANPGTRPCR